MMKLYRKKALQPMEPWTSDTDMTGVSVSEDDSLAGSPQVGDMIAHNPANPEDRWLIASAFFNANYEPVETVT